MQPKVGSIMVKTQEKKEPSVLGEMAEGLASKLAGIVPKTPLEVKTASIGIRG